MSDQRFPPAWDEERVKRLIAHYDSLSEEEQVAEDEAAVAEQKGQTVITVPETLLPAIRQLLADSAHRKSRVVNDSARYMKIVEWSDEDQCFVGQCPGVVGQCCHGDNEADVYAELCQIVEECLEISKARWETIAAVRLSGREFQWSYSLRRELDPTQ